MALNEPFGLLIGTLNEPYTNAATQLTGDSNSLVGVYYIHKRETNILLFRSFDGSTINYFRNSITLERLASHHMVTNLRHLQFDVDAWELHCWDSHHRISQKRESLFERFRQAIASNLISRCNYSENDRRKIVRNALGFPEDNVVNGYYRINEIVFSTCGGSFHQVGKSVHRRILSSRFLSGEIALTSNASKKYPDPSPGEVISESYRYLSSCVSSFVNLIYEDEQCQHRFKETLKRLPHPVYPLADTSRETCLDLRMLELFRETISAEARGEPRLEPRLEALIKCYNHFAQKCEQPALDKVKIPVSKEFVTEDINVTLRCGKIEAVHLDRTDFSEFSENEIVDVLRYIRSLKEPKLSTLVTRLVETLTLRLELNRNHY